MGRVMVNRLAARGVKVAALDVNQKGLDETAVGILAGALARLESHPVPARLEGPTREMFHYLAPEMSFGMRLVMGNLWLTSPLVLCDIYERYPRWCRVKSKVDPGNYLQSAYVQGTVYSESGRSEMSESTLSLCSSVWVGR